MNKEIKLSVNDLKVSFRTDAGQVQAVRNISFDLYKGETLAIVGESGSGKSVTSKAIMGISAGNSIYEGGEILYDGQDLTRIPEEEMHKLRGDKIAMIFQDPLSALNPIMRIGKQITEAMLLKNKANRKEGRIVFNKTLAVLSETIKKAIAEKPQAGVTAADVDKYIKTFDNFNIQAIKLENSYNDARTAAEEMIAVIEDLLFMTENKQKVDVVASLGLVKSRLKEINDKYFVTGYADQLKDHAAALDGVIREERSKVSAFEIVKKVAGSGASKNEASAQTVETLKAMKKTAQEMLERPQYDFFRIGYYVFKHPEKDLSQMPAEQANEMALKFLDEDFMDSFMVLVKLAVQYSFEKNVVNKKAAVKAIQEAIDFFRAGNFNAQEADKACKRVNGAVTAAIDPMAIVKDNVAYTFGSSLEREVEKYFFYVKNNPKEEARFARQTAQREALLAKGKKVDWKIVPKSVIELSVQIETIVSVLKRVMDKFNADIAVAGSFDADKRCTEIIDFLKEKASQVVYTLTKRIAKEKAIKLMEEVGIPEARMRYRQYPFEFSGGMRQRIVIAIALSANPDILICDEPTTALDVTIQAQILELMKALQKDFGTAILFITHDLGVGAKMCDRVAVMYLGKIVESADATEIYANPQHPYTRGLSGSVHKIGSKKTERLFSIEGTVPLAMDLPEACGFYDRCDARIEGLCDRADPELVEVAPGHKIACFNCPHEACQKHRAEVEARLKEKEGAKDA